MQENNQEKIDTFVPQVFYFENHMRKVCYDVDKFGNAHHFRNDVMSLRHTENSADSNT